MAIEVEANGKTFTFPNGTSREDIASAIEEYFASQEAPQEEVQAVKEPPQEEQGFIEASAETVETIGRGIVGEIGGGLRGLFELAITQDPEKAATAIEQFKSSVQKVPEGERSQEQLQNISDAVNMAVDAVNVPLSGLAGLTELATGQGAEQAAETVKTVQEEGISKAAGERVFEETGSPIAATIAETAPTAAAELAGLGLGRRAAQSARRGATPAQIVASNVPSERQVRSAIIEAAPSLDEIKDASRALYKEIDDTGAQVSDDSYLNLVVDIREMASKSGHRASLNPKSEAVIRELENEIGMSHKVSDIDSLRKVAQQAAKSIDPSDSRIGSKIIDKIDDYLDDLSPSDIVGDIDADQVGNTYRRARELWGRNKKQSIIQDAIERAELQASGFENGLRTQFRQILNNKRKRRAFTEAEINDMKKIVEGTKGANYAKFLGRFGMTEGQATSALGAAISAGAGGAVGGAPGAAASLAVGQFSKNLAQRLTKNNARFADAVVRAGRDGEKIARAYLQNTPKTQRSPNELKELLLERRMPAEMLQELSTNRDKTVSAAALAAIAASKRDEE